MPGLDPENAFARAEEAKKILKDNERTIRNEEERKMWSGEEDEDLALQQKLAHEIAQLAHEKAQRKNEPGLRYDAGKLRYDLIPPEVLGALAKVYTDGAEKYHDRNWEAGMSYSRCIRCIFSHLVKYLCGYRFDEEFKDCEHMAMVMWNAAAILTYDKRNMAARFNDLPHWKFKSADRELAERIERAAAVDAFAKSDTE